MDQTQHLKIIEVLQECFDQAKFESFLPYLSKDIRRTSMWYDEDIVGLDSVKAYFKDKEMEMIGQNRHYHATVAYLKYVDGQPLTFTDHLRVEAAEGSLSGNEPLPAGTRIMMWYPEHEPVLIIRRNPYLNPEVMIRLEIDNDGMVNRYHIVNHRLYAYEEVYDTDTMSQDEIQFLGIMAAARFFKELDYQVEPISFEGEIYPHLDVKNDQEHFHIIALCDHDPFFGHANKHIRKIASQLMHKNFIPIKIVQSQIIGQGEKPYRIGQTDDFHIRIIEIDDLHDILSN